MKKICIALLFISLIVLSSCSTSKVDMNNLKVGILKENKRVESIVSSFESSKEKAEEFNSLFLQSFYNEQTENSNLNDYLDFDRDINSTLDMLIGLFRESKEKNFSFLSKEGYLEVLKSNSQDYLFLEENTGNIDDLIILNDGYKTIFITFIWDEGVIINYSFDETIS